jgi:hypothetical protein
MRSRDDLNAFNPIMNLGHRLSRWFADEFGGTRCYDITRCDFATAGGVAQYVESRGVARCEAIVRRVAQEVRRTVDAGA